MLAEPTARPIAERPVPLVGVGPVAADGGDCPTDLIPRPVHTRHDSTMFRSGDLLAGRFRLDEPLGRGGMGRVFRAYDEMLDRPVAIKLMYDDAIGERERRRACAIEARAAARLSHPGIARIFDSGFHDGHCFVVMELVDGASLASILQEHGPLPLRPAIDLAIQIADALDAAHRQSVVHCDVKPANILVTTDGQARLVDFGIASASVLTTGLDDAGLYGSAEFIAPEQITGEPVDGRTDVYALGIVLYELLSGTTPFRGGSLASVVARRLAVDPKPLDAVAPAVPRALAEVVQVALARDPDARFASAAAFRDALTHVRDALDRPHDPDAQARAAGPDSPTQPVAVQRGRRRGAGSRIVTTARAALPLLRGSATVGGERLRVATLALRRHAASLHAWLGAASAQLRQDGTEWSARGRVALGEARTRLAAGTRQGRRLTAAGLAHACIQTRVAVHAASRALQAALLAAGDGTDAGLAELARLYRDARPWLSARASHARTLTAPVAPHALAFRHRMRGEPVALALAALVALIAYVSLALALQLGSPRPPTARAGAPTEQAAPGSGQLVPTADPRLADAPVDGPILPPPGDGPAAR